MTALHGIAAAINGCRFFLGVESHCGIVQQGPADLVLLDENPLTDIRHIESIVGVMRAGQWLPVATLEAMLAEAASFDDDLHLQLGSAKD